MSAPNPLVCNPKDGFLQNLVYNLEKMLKKHVSLCLCWHEDASHSWQEHRVHAVGSAREPVKQCERENCTLCNIVCAIDPQLIFLGHLSAGSYLHCSNLSAYYVTPWPTLPYTHSLSVNFHSAPCTPGLTYDCWWNGRDSKQYNSRLKLAIRWKKSMNKRRAHGVNVHFQPVHIPFSLDP